MAGKKKAEKYSTPVGIAAYPYLTNPDTKFVPEGEYKVKLILSESEAAPLMKLIDEAMEENFQAIKKDKKIKGKIKMADAPYSPVEDDEGDETGEIGFNFKQKAVIKRKKDGRTFEMKVHLFDAKAKPIKLKGYVGGGSKIKVAFELIPFFTKLIGAGISLRLRAVQILELVEGGISAEDCGFGEEEGYEGTPLSEVKDDAPFDSNDNTEDF